MFSIITYARQLLKEWIQYPKQQRALFQKIVERIRNSLELKVVLQTAVDEIATLLRLQRCSFLWYFEDTQRVQVVVERIEGQRASGLGYYPLEAFGAAGSAIAAGELIINGIHGGGAARQPVLRIFRGLIPQLRNHQQKTGSCGTKPQEWLLREGCATLFIPVKRQEGWVGFIACISENPRYWSSVEIEFLQSIAQQLEISIHQAQLYEQTQKQAQREHLVNQITSQTRQSFDLERILTEAITQLMEALSADRCLVHLVEDPSSPSKQDSELSVLPSELESLTHASKLHLASRILSSGMLDQSPPSADNIQNPTTPYTPYPAPLEGFADRRKHLYEVCRDPFTPSSNDFDTYGPITQWVIQHGERVIISDVTRDERIGNANQEYQKAQIKSSLVVPAQANGRIYAILYLNQCSHIRYWSKNDQKLAQAVADQLAISIHQANLYAQTQLSAAENAAKAKQLAETLLELQLTQAQLIQSEKMSSLGRMIAGLAHELNNPVSFIYGNIPYLENYVCNLIRVLKAYQLHYPESTAEIQQLSEEVELDFLVKDITKIFNSMETGAERIQEIVKSLQHFSHLNEAPLKPVEIRAALESTLFVLHNQLGNGIRVMSHYEELPLVECYPQPLNQVFLSILTNAIEALSRWSDSNKIITVRTELLPDSPALEPWVRIVIADNGPGICQEIQPKIFDPFFTTKDVGQGRGLGLAISYQIIVNQHQGRLECYSEKGLGAEFVIEIPVKQPNPLTAEMSAGVASHLSINRQPLTVDC